MVPWRVAFNIKDETVLAELKAIARLTDSTMSSELALAIHNRLVAVREIRDGKLERLRALSQRSAQKWGNTADDPTDVLYDPATGLPQ